LGDVGKDWKKRVTSWDIMLTCPLNVLGWTYRPLSKLRMTGHTPDNAGRFENLAERTPEVVSLWTLTGDADYMLRVYCKSLAALNSLVHDVFLPHEAVARVQTKIVMKQLKMDTGLPVG